MLRPLADGGPGFVDVLGRGRWAAGVVPVPTADPLGRPAAGAVLLDGDTAYVESAQACGLHLLAAAERDPQRTTTSYGLGLLLAAAVECGAREVVVGLGGSATNDGGAGMLAALGAAPLDAAGYALPYGGAGAGRASPALGGAPAAARRPAGRGDRRGQPADRACTAPATSSARRRAPPRQDVLLLDAALERFAGVLERDLPGVPGRAGRAARRRARPAGSAPRSSPSAAAASPGIGLVSRR